MVILLAVLLLAPEYRKSALLLLVVGADSHHVLDLLLQNASGYAYPVLWPVTEYSPPAGMLYRSSDRWPAKVATVVAGVVSCVDRRWIDRVASRM